MESKKKTVKGKWKERECVTSAHVYVWVCLCVNAGAHTKEARKTNGEKFLIPPLIKSKKKKAR